MVSVCMVSYNQEKYVRDAIDSILMQKTNFEIEIIVSDDCSKDATPQILKEYEKRFPGVVKPMLGEVNLGYPNNQRRSLEAASGKYIALCDSDDYWTDAYKLQKQVDYLETHDDCVICFHNVMHIYDDNSQARSLVNPLDFPTELTALDVINRKWFLPTNSEVFRREYLTFPTWYDEFLHIDYVINILLAQHGSLHYFPDVMSVYRHTPISVNAQHVDGRWGYMIFHCNTMKGILTKVKTIYGSDYAEHFDARIKKYEDEIKEYEYEKYCENHFLARVFRVKTYRRLVKNFLRRLLHQ